MRSWHNCRQDPANLAPSLLPKYSGGVGGKAPAFFDAKNYAFNFIQSAIYAPHLRSGARTQRPKYKMTGQGESAPYANGQLADIGNVDV
jgi:hypothetical protein